MKRIFVLGTLLALAAAAVLGLATRGEAQLDPGDKAFFGLVGIAPGETLRLAVVNAGLSTPPEPDDVCRVRLGFADLSGRLLQARVEVRLPGGAGGFADLPYDRLGAGGGRVEVHPLANVVGGRVDPASCGVDVVAEVVDDATGRTEVYALPVVPET